MNSDNINRVKHEIAKNQTEDTKTRKKKKKEESQTNEKKEMTKENRICVVGVRD